MPRYDLAMDQRIEWLMLGTILGAVTQLVLRTL